MTDNANHTTDKPRLRVWDPWVRLFHWTLVTAVAIAWFGEDGPVKLHEGVGYLALALVAFRILWGWMGTRYARFGQFVRSPLLTWRYAMSFMAGREARYIGHNPLGGWMILALLTMVVATGLTGWLFTTEAYWGVKWMKELHEGCANTLIIMVALHIGGVIVESWRHRENLAAAMISGEKEAPAPGDVV